MSKHLESAELLALAASHDDDPAMLGARAHVIACPDCQARLHESAALIGLLDREDQPARVPLALRARVLRHVETKRAAAAAWAKLAASAAVLSSLMLAYLDGRGSDLRLGDLVPELGGHCLAFQGAFAALPLVVGMVLSRAGRVRLSPLPFAAWTMSFAVLGQVALRGHCGASNLSVHLFAVHFTGVLLAGLIGGGVGRLLADPPRA